MSTGTANADLELFLCSEDGLVNALHGEHVFESVSRRVCEEQLVDKVWGSHLQNGEFFDVISIVSLQDLVRT